MAKKGRMKESQDKSAKVGFQKQNYISQHFPYPRKKFPVLPRKR
jgi:hypothetical protein